MEFNTRDIAAYLNGQVVGNGDVKVTSISKIEDGKPGTLTFLANPKYENYIYSTLGINCPGYRVLKPKEAVKLTLIRWMMLPAFDSLLDC